MGDKIGTFLFCLICWAVLSLGIALLGNIIVKLRNYNDVFLNLSYFADLKWFAVIILALYFVKIYKSLLMSPNIVYCKVVGGEYLFSTSHKARNWPIQIILSRTGKAAIGNVVTNGEVIPLSSAEVANYAALYEMQQVKSLEHV